MKYLTLIAALIAAPAAAAVPLTGTLFGDTVYASGTNAAHAQPWGTTGRYLATTGSGGIIFDNLPSGARSFSFLHGSVDTYNTAWLIGTAGQVLQTFTFTGNGDQGAGGNALTRIYFTPGTVKGFGMASTRPAFEATNFTAEVPEPAVWMTLLFGFGLVGARMRDRTRAAAA